MGYRNDNDALTVMDWFCGAGGSSQGAHAIPGLRVERAANHWERAIESHARNFPDVDHYRGDIREAPVERWPVTDLFWASPECPQWSNARGKKRDFDAFLQGDLFEGFGPSEEVERSRAHGGGAAVPARRPGARRAGPRRRRGKRGRRPGEPVAVGAAA